MDKPYLIIVTGRPGAGKTTFSQALGAELFLPVISRDQIKEGYVHTFGKRHNELPPEANGIATKIFVETVMGLVKNNVSVIVEAAFQHKLWSTLLEPFYGMARMCLVICSVDGQVALERFVKRGLDNPLREYFHGDKGVDMARQGMELTVSPYEEPRLDVPTFRVDTTGAYNPSLKELASKILSV